MVIIMMMLKKDENGKYEEKSRIRETLNLSTDADHRTNIFLGGDDKKKKFKKNYRLRDKKN